MNLSPTSPAIASTSTLSLVRNSRRPRHRRCASARCRSPRIRRREPLRYRFRRARRRCSPPKAACRDALRGDFAPRVMTSDTAKRPPGLQDAERFPQHLVLVGGQVDDAIRNDHVHRIVRQGDRFDLALKELDILRPGRLLVLPGERQHLVGHVEPIGLACRTDTRADSRTSMPAARAQIKHRLAQSSVRRCGRVAAAQRGQHGGFRQLPGFLDRVQVRSDRTGRVKRSARSRTPRRAVRPGRIFPAPRP